MIKVNGVLVDISTFPNGESRIATETLPELGMGDVEVTLKYQSDADLMALLFVKEHLDSLGKTANLLITYMPYSRMDRTEGKFIFTLKHVSKFINNLNFKKVTVLEPHSDVTLALLDRAQFKYPTKDLLGEVLIDMKFNDNRDIIFFPDAGAQKRYKDITDYMTLVGNKTRDFTTGRITNMEIEGIRPSDFFNALIVDDLCSYGGTFILAAKSLRAIGATKVFLFVTHCEDSILKGELFDHIDGVYTTNSILTQKHDKIHIIKQY